MDGSGEGVRLQKVLAEAGVASRRQAEILMRQGRVEVDGKVVKEMGLRVDPDRSVIHVDGDRIVTDTETVHLALNKPEGMLSTMWDEQGRRCVGDVVLEKAEGQRLFHVGRLDAATEGLLLLTNDGELANRLMHPSYEVPKTYLAEVRAPIPKDLGRRLRDGVELDDGPVAVDSFRVIDERTVAYLDLTGSGAETIAHTRQNGRITIMFCAFEGPPRIVRLYGRGEVLEPGEPGFEALVADVGDLPGARAAIRVSVERISSSCGFSIPFMDYVGERPTLSQWAEKKSDEALDEYRAEKNAVSIDGLPGMSLS